MSLLKLDNFTEAILGKYEPATLNENFTDCGFMSTLGEDFFKEERTETKSLNESFSGSLNECSVFSLDDMNESCKKLNETAVVAPSYELEDVNKLIEDAKTALEEKDMDDMYLMGHTIYMFLEDYADELNDIIVDELDKLQNELEAEAQKLDESCNKKNLKEGFADDLFNRAVNIAKEVIEDNFDSGDVPEVKEVETLIKENMGEFNGLVGDQAEVIDVAATYFDLPSIIEAAIDDLEENGFFGILEEAVEEPEKVLKFHYKGETDPLQIDHLVKTFGELPKEGWYTEEEWNALPSVDSQYGYLQWDDLIQEFDAEDEDYRNQFFEMRPVNESLTEDTASARPNHLAIIDMLESGYLDYKETCEELLRWMPDNELGRFIEIYADFEDLEEDLEGSIPMYVPAIKHLIELNCDPTKVPTIDEIIDMTWDRSAKRNLSRDDRDEINRMHKNSYELDFEPIIRDAISQVYNVSKSEIVKNSSMVEEIKPTHRGRKLHSEE